MTLRVTYIGEDVSASGFALAGARVHRVPADPDRVRPLLEAARGDSDLVILNEAHALCVGDALHALLLREPVPPVLVLPAMDVRAGPPREVVRRARSVLGLTQPGSSERTEEISQ
jgi:vacuolar-type H+-ATPase subunit F/Vma7